MSKDYSFSVMPSVSISRSRFNRKSQHKTSLKHGEITPIYLDEVLPGDTRSIDMASLVRMSTPIAPIMDNIYIDYFAFFVPMRLVWDHAKEFFGENRESAGIPANTYTIPMCKCNEGDLADIGSLWDHFGLPTNFYLSPDNAVNSLEVSALPFRAYYLIYNEWFRNQNIIAPLAVDTGDTGLILTDHSVDVGLWTEKLGGFLCKASKLADYFTKALPYAQKGSAVSIPLGTTAPIIGTSNTSAYGTVGTGLFAYQDGTTIVPISAGLGDQDSVTGGQNISSYDFNQEEPTVFPIIKANTLLADLSTATAATINQLRYAFQLQKLLEKDALYGSRYWEILAAHFGVRSPDASLQRPEYLGGYRQNINIDQVLSTAGATSDTSTKLGQPGANSVTASKGSLFTKSFTEHGYIMIMAVPRADHTYSQGVNRMWKRSGRYDFYWPVFANLGAQEVKLGEIYNGIDTASDSVDPDVLFGYQEAWAEYRYKPSLTTGFLRPEETNGLDFWTLTDEYSAAPTLSQTWIEEPRTFVDRALTTGNSTDEYIADFYFLDVAVRPMPVYSIPGLIDHH